MAKKVNTLEQARKNIGRQIKERRKQKAISTYGLAVLIDKPQPRIPEIENGKVKDIDIYAKCLETLGGKFEIKWD